jgi:hypothetical protein
MSLTESKTVEQMILDAIAKVPKPGVRESSPVHRGDSLGGELRPAGWDYVHGPLLRRQDSSVIVRPKISILAKQGATHE